MFLVAPADQVRQLEILYAVAWSHCPDGRRARPIVILPTAMLAGLTPPHDDPWYSTSRDIFTRVMPESAANR